MKKPKTLLLSLTIVACNLLYSQVGIGTTNPQAALDVNSKIGGVAVSRLTTEEINALVLPAKSSIVYNTDTDELNYNFGTPEIPNWKRLKTVEPPAEIHLVPQNISIAIPNPPISSSLTSILSPKSENYDHSVFSYNNPNGTITLLKVGLYEVCGQFLGGNSIGQYSLEASINGTQTTILVKVSTDVNGGNTASGGCASFNTTQENSTVIFTFNVGGSEPGSKSVILYYVSARKIE